MSSYVDMNAFIQARSVLDQALRDQAMNPKDYASLTLEEVRKDDPSLEKNGTKLAYAFRVLELVEGINNQFGSAPSVPLEGFLRVIKEKGDPDLNMSTLDWAMQVAEVIGLRTSATFLDTIEKGRTNLERAAALTSVPMDNLAAIAKEKDRFPEFTIQ